MVKQSLLVLSTLALTVYASSPVSPLADEPLTGPAYLPPANGSFSVFDDARAKAKAWIDQAVATGQSEYGAIDTQETSFSVSVFSTHSNETLFTYHYEAPLLNGSYTRGKLTDDTIYRTGSIGKLLSIYQFLVDVGDSVYYDPITKYIPELASAPYDNPLEQVNWNEITLGSIAAQLSGLGRDFRLADYAIGSIISPGQKESVALAIENGFPPPVSAIPPTCAFYSYELPLCDRATFLQGLIEHPVTFPSYTKAAYSNIAYPLLAMAYEKITGQSFKDGFNSVYRDRIGMSSAYADSPPEGVDAVIPYNDSYATFTYSIGLQWPAGGQYLSTRDYQAWGRAILQSSLLPKVTTRRWIKPQSVTGQWASDVGAPWEIFRLPIPVDSTLNSTRIVDIYTKGGDVGVYSTAFCLVPDHNIGFTVLAAGAAANPQVQPLKSIIAELFINAAEAAAKEQARNAFTGTFVSSDPNINSSITLEVDSGPGVVITEWISNGTDFKNSPLIAAIDARLYPSQLKRTGENGVVWQGFRALMLPERLPDAADLWPQYKDTWYFPDSRIYDNRATDGFNVEFDRNGIVQTIEPHSLRIKLQRQ